VRNWAVKSAVRKAVRRGRRDWHHARVAMACNAVTVKYWRDKRLTHRSASAP